MIEMIAVYRTGIDGEAAHLGWVDHDAANYRFRTVCGIRRDWEFSSDLEEAISLMEHQQRMGDPTDWWCSDCLTGNT